MFGRIAANFFEKVVRDTINLQLNNIELSDSYLQNVFNPKPDTTLQYFKIESTSQLSYEDPEKQ